MDFRFAFILLLLVSQLGCTGQKTYEPMMISKDNCHHCKMLITDKRFGAELVTSKGKVYKFDSIECLGSYLQENKGTTGTVYLVDSFDDKKMIEVKSAFFIHNPNLRSPMGKGIFSGTSEEIEKYRKQENREVLIWKDVLKLIGKPELSI
ncbi:MAG: nitrous oxide reductase accessory protein NosL [Pseudobdellovibrionaceae bacterium]